MQTRNSELVRNLRSDFWHLTDPLLVRARAQAAALTWPGLRGWFPAYNTNFGITNIVDTSRMSMDQTNDPVWTVDGWLNYQAYTRASSQYMSSTYEALWAAVGTEVWAEVAGQTLATWVRLTSVPAAMGLMTKWKADTNQRSWRLFYYDTNDVFRADMSSDGSSTEAVAESTVNPSLATWYFVVNRWKPSTSNEIWVLSDGVDDRVTNTTSIPATIYNSTANMLFADYINSGAGHNYLDGDLSHQIFAATYVPDHLIEAYYYATYPLFF